MNSQQLNRRDFLKFLGTVLAGVFLFKFQNLFGRDHPKEKKNLKEARYYKAADHLAG